tara:strand:+ start:2124 stop:2270 length:147 start_codon:yes stop_codon:yes gene_type:complete
MAVLRNFSASGHALALWASKSGEIHEACMSVQPPGSICAFSVHLFVQA